MIDRRRWIVGLVLGVGCASGPGTPSPTEVAGCYALELGEWNPPLQPVEAPFQTPPPVFELLDSLGNGSFESGQLLARPTIGPEGFDGGNAYWMPGDGDSARVVWTTGYVMVELRLGGGGDRFEGVATARTDAVVPGQSWPTASAVAVSVPCASG